jgi:predicted TIM-barrel fold metal-dependent hydrolase
MLRRFFDVGITLGRPAVPKYRLVDDARAMKGELAEFGITGGLVQHVLGAEAGPQRGNDALSDELAGVEGFHMAWAVMPHWTGEFPAPDELARSMKARGAKAVVMYPTTQGFGLGATACGALFEMLSETRVPVMLPVAEAALPVIEDIARRHPKLRIVAMGVAHPMTRVLYPVLAACPEVRFEISGFMLHRGIEEVCAKFGAKRMLFGTRYPLYNPGCAVMAVNYAEIADDAKEAIAHGNAERLVGEVRL